MKMTITCSRHPASYTCKDKGVGNNSHSSSNNSSSYPSRGDSGHDGGRAGSGGNTISTSETCSAHKSSLSTKYDAGFLDYSGYKGNMIAESLRQLITVKAPYNFKCASFSHSNMDDTGALALAQVLERDNFNFDSMYYSNNRIGDAGVFYTFNSLKVHPTLFHCVVKLDVSNNYLTDNAACMFGTGLMQGQLPYLKALDIHGNTQITPTGYGYFVTALNSPQTQDIAITLAVKNDKNAVWEFVTKGSSYYLKEFVTYFKNFSIDTTMIKTDESSAFMHCKKAVPEAVVGVTLGIVKCTNPIAKVINSLPLAGEKASFTTKLVGKLGLFACVMAEEGDNIFTPDTLGCVAEGYEFSESCIIL